MCLIFILLSKLEEYNAVNATNIGRCVVKTYYRYICLYLFGGKGGLIINLGQKCSAKCENYKSMSKVEYCNTSNGTNMVKHVLKF